MWWIFFLFLRVLCHVFPNPSKIQLPSSPNFVSFFKSFKTNYCFQNILGCVVFHWRATSLHGATLLNCLFLSQQLSTASSSMARGEILCWNPISILWFVWLRLAQALGMMVQLWVNMDTHTTVFRRQSVLIFIVWLWLLQSSSVVVSEPWDWAGIYVSFRAKHFTVSFCEHCPAASHCINYYLLLIEASYKRIEKCPDFWV